MTSIRFNDPGERIIALKNGDITNIYINDYKDWLPKILMHDQEPVFYFGQKKNWLRLWNSLPHLDARAIILTSEKNSDDLDSLCELTGALPCHWFSNGALALEWYDSHRMKLTDNTSNKLLYKFSCLNRLISHQRAYRPILSSFLMHTVRNDWLQLSCNVIDPNTNTHACQTETKLPAHHRALLDRLIDKRDPILINTKNGENRLGVIENQSFDVSSYYFDRTFCHIVTETLYYGRTLHLTEKSLRPIANRRPFVMVGPPNSLEYLRGYGFKTFGDFWNEDYDKIEDANDRLDAVMDVIKTINEWPLPKMQSILSDMREVLDHNYNHFYSDFWRIIKQELIDNIDACIAALTDKFRPGLLFKAIESMSQEEYETYAVKNNFADQDVTLYEIMRTADSEKLKIQSILLYKELVEPFNPQIKTETGKEQFLASLRSIMNK